MENTSKNGLKYKRYIGGDVCLACPVYGLCTKAKGGGIFNVGNMRNVLEK